MPLSIGRATCVLGMLVSLAGCGSVRSVMYSPARDAQGQAAKTSWANVDLPGQIKLARKNHAALLTDQLNALDELGRANRAIAARDLARGDDSLENLLIKPIQDELALLADSRSGMAAWSDASDDYDNADKAVTKAFKALQQDGIRAPSTCAKIEEIDALVQAYLVDRNTKRALLEEHEKQYKVKCADRQSKLAALKSINLPAGDLHVAQQAVKDAEQDLTNAQQTLAPQVAEFRRTVAAYEAALKKQSADREGADLIEARDKLVEAIGAANSAGKSFDGALGTQVLSNEQVKAVDKFLVAFAKYKADGTVPGPDASHAASALAHVSELAKDSENEWAETETPNLAPLLLAKSLAQASADEATREIELRKLEIDLRSQRFALLAQRYDQLNLALVQLQVSDDPVKFFPDSDKKSAASFLAPVTPFPPRFDSAKIPADRQVRTLKERSELIDMKQRIWIAATYYLDDVGRLKPAAQKPLYQLNALAHDRLITLSERNLMLWNTVITSTVGQSAVYAASGIKASDIKALIDSAALLYIGKGVN